MSRLTVRKVNAESVMIATINNLVDCISQENAKLYTLCTDNNCELRDVMEIIERLDAALIPAKNAIERFLEERQ